jgi:hypothetical protein
MTTIRLIIIDYVFMSCILCNIILEISGSQTHAVVNFSGKIFHFFRK